MSATLRRTKKSSKKEVYKKLMAFLIDVTETRFTVRFVTDDGGAHVTSIIERDENDKISFKKRVPSVFMGWRSVMLFVPSGYIDVFYKEKDSEIYA